MTTSKGSPFLSSPSAHARTLFRLARSSATSSKLPPLAAASCGTCAVAASAFFKSRAAPTTCAPCAARERAVSTPSPAETPVTKIRLPRRLIPDKTSSVVEVAPNTSTIVFLLALARSSCVPTPPVLTGRHDLGKTESVSESLDNRRLSPVTWIFAMPKKHSQHAGRRPRSDAQQNRDRILEVAKAAFTRSDADTSLDDIAKQAGVGPGTLYRHFPTRDALIEAVYRTEVEKLAAAQRELSANLPPIEALRAWMMLFVDYIATKQIIASVLNSVIGGPSRLYDCSRIQVTGAIDALVKTAMNSGDIRKDLKPFDLLRALIGVSNVATGPDWQDSARRLVDILITGSRPM